MQAAAGVRKLMQEAKERFPQDMEYAIALDTTLAVTEGLKEIQQTLFEAIVLVIIVVLYFSPGLASHTDSAARSASIAGRHIRRFSRCSASPSTRSLCSDWYWRSVWSWMTPS